MEPGALVADRAVDIGVDEVLSRALQGPRGVAEPVEVRDGGDVDQDRGPDPVLRADPAERGRLVEVVVFGPR